MPSGIPTRSESDDSREHQRERLHALAPRGRMQRERRERGERPDRGARTPPKRSTTSTPTAAAPSQVIQSDELVEPGDEVVQERREAVEGSEDEARVVGVALVDEPGLEVVEVRRQRGPDEPARPRVLALETEVADQHHADDRGDLSVTRLRHHGRCSRGARTPSGGRCSLGDRRHRQSSPSPAIAWSTASRSTTPTICAVLHGSTRASRSRR